MSFKRLAASTINWQYLTDRVPEHQRPQFTLFKRKYEQFLRVCFEFPAEAPKIDWNFYRENISLPGIVDSFEKEYNDVKVDYPPESVSPQIDAYEKEVKENIDAHLAESTKNIESLKKRHEFLNSMIPFDEMTMEDFRIMYPEIAIDPIKNPTFWPHNSEEQIGYVPEEDKKT